MIDAQMAYKIINLKTDINVYINIIVYDNNL